MSKKDSSSIIKIRKEALGQVFLEDHAGVCSPEQQCAFCRARILLQQAGILEEVQEIVDDWYVPDTEIRAIPIKDLPLNNYEKRSFRKRPELKTLGDVCNFLKQIPSGTPVDDDRQYYCSLLEGMGLMWWK